MTVIDHISSWWHRFWGWHPAYWLRSHTFTRYHVVDGRTPEYRWGWIDRDNLMFNACFNILVDFVENEDPAVGFRGLGDYAYEGMGEDARESIMVQVRREREVREIYQWWKVDRWEERRACSRMMQDLPEENFDVDESGAWVTGARYRSPEFKAWCDEANRLDAKDEEMLDRLMKVRQALWT